MKQLQLLLPEVKSQHITQISKLVGHVIIKVLWAVTPCSLVHTHQRFALHRSHSNDYRQNLSILKTQLFNLKQTKCEVHFLTQYYAHYFQIYYHTYTETTARVLPCMVAIVNRRWSKAFSPVYVLADTLNLA